MKQIARTLWPLLIMAISVVLISSCSPGPQSSNTPNIANKTTVTSNEGTELATSDSDDPCKETHLGTKVTKLKKAVEDKIMNDTSGDDPLATQFNRNFYLEFKEGTGPQAGYAIAYVSGAIQGEKKFKKLADFIEDFVKKGCKIKVVYRASENLVGIDPPDGFEWCEHPLIACPGGYCAESCGFMESNTNTNANSNSNSNRTKSNTVSNSNRTRSP